VTVKAFSTELLYLYPIADIDKGIVPRAKLTIDGVSDITALKPDVEVTPTTPSTAPAPGG